MDIDKYRSTETSINLLKQRYKQLSGFTHILTHDLRNHTGNISLLASLVDKKLLDENNADLFDKLNHVAENLSLTIDHLSEIVKVNENVMETEVLNFNHHLLSALSLLDADLNINEAHIQTDFLVPSIVFPKLYLDSILMNLLSNSIKYKKDSISPEIFICTYKDEDQNCIVLEYQDNGIGIDLNKHADKVFGLYNTFTNRPGAHGVGLFLVKNQIESQGGYVLIESTPHVGTIFRIFFKPNG
jgi:signal transduction histidine kinase